MKPLFRHAFFFAAILLVLPVTALAVDNDGDGAEDDVDCDDDDAANFPGNPEVCDGQDNDCEGTADFDAAGEVDGDGDGVISCADCDDHDAQNFLDNIESCDGQDNDCDTLVDEADDDVVLIQWYPDEDGDGVGVLPPGPFQCDQPAGYASETIDCDDNDPRRFPGNIEICDDEIDQDCDELQRDTGAEDDIDGDGETPEVCGGTDCDDTEATVNAAGEETCGDGIDQDCDGRDSTRDDDQDGDGENPTGDRCYGTDCDDNDAGQHTRDEDGDGASPCFGDCDDEDPLARVDFDEVCNDGIDNDCSGGVDDIDLDGDGWIIPECDGDDPEVTRRDCDDEDPAIHPADEDEKVEDGPTCVDEVDNDCDGLVDISDPDCQLEPEVDGGVSQQDRYLGGTILVALDGTGTTDGNIYETLQYTWTMLTDPADYPGVTAELLTDPSDPVAYLRFSAEAGSEQSKWTFDFQLVVSDGIYTTDSDDENGAVRVEIFRPTVFGLDGCSIAAPTGASGWSFALALGLLGLIRRRSHRTL